MSVAGLTQAETTAIAAAFISADVPNSSIDWDKAMTLMGSVSVGGARERLRLAKKKAEKLFGQDGAPVTTGKGAGKAPAGGVDKKSRGNVKRGQKKDSVVATPADKGLKVKEEIKEEIEDIEDSAVEPDFQEEV